MRRYIVTIHKVSIRKPFNVMVSSAVMHLIHTICLHKQRFASIIGKDKINKAKAKFS